MSRIDFSRKGAWTLLVAGLVVAQVGAQKSVTPLQEGSKGSGDEALAKVPITGKWLGRLELGPSRIQGTVSLGDAQNLAVSKAFLKQVRLDLVLQSNGDLLMTATGYAEQPKVSKGRWSRLGKVVTLKVLEESGKPAQRILQGFLTDESRFVVNLPNAENLPSTKFVFRRGPVKAAAGKPEKPGGSAKKG